MTVSIQPALSDDIKCAVEFVFNFQAIEQYLTWGVFSIFIMS